MVNFLQTYGIFFVIGLGLGIISFYKILGFRTKRQINYNCTKASIGVKINEGKILHKYHGQGKFGLELITTKGIVYAECKEEYFNKLEIEDIVSFETIMFLVNPSNPIEIHELRRNIVLTQEETETFLNMKDSEEGRNRFLYTLANSMDTNLVH